MSAATYTYPPAIKLRALADSYVRTFLHYRRDVRTFRNPALKADLLDCIAATRREIANCRQKAALQDEIAMRHGYGRGRIA